MTEDARQNLLADEEWRLNNLYFIKDKQGNRVRFNMNWAQKILYRTMHFLNMVLKARQLGCTTFIQIFMLDRCLFNENTSAGVIADTVEHAQSFFDDKIKFAWDNLDPELKQAIGEVSTNNTREIKFGNGSSIYVSTSMRSGTLQYLHVSEFGKMCAEFPKKAKEVVTGSLNTVAVGQFIWIESTAEGRQGKFYEMCQVARALERENAPLTSMDYKFFFFPWYKHPDYQLKGENVRVPERLREYFLELQREEGIELTTEQIAWYVKKEGEQGDDMKQEYPATPDEAFERMLKGAIFAEQLRSARRDARITTLPHVRGKPVNTFWDLGRNDINSIWFHQHVSAWEHFLLYYEHRLVDITHYIEVMNILAQPVGSPYSSALDGIKPMGFQWGTMYLPHDGKTRHIESVAGSVKDILVDNGFKVRVVNRTQQKTISIEDTRRKFSSCRFDAGGCDAGLRCLEGYQWTWDEQGETYRKQPMHNYASNGADAFQTFGFGYRGEDGTFASQMRDIDGTGGRKYARDQQVNNPLTNPSYEHIV